MTNLAVISHLHRKAFGINNIYIYRERESEGSIIIIIIVKIVLQINKNQ